MIYHKKTYQKEQELIADEFDVQKRQAPKKIFNRVNKEKDTDYRYSFKKHLDVLYGNLPKEKVKELIEKIDEINAFAEC